MAHAGLASSSAASGSGATIISAEAGQGLAVSGNLSMRGGDMGLLLVLENKTQSTLSKFAVQMNNNALGLRPRSGNVGHIEVPGGVIAPGSRAAASFIPMTSDAAFVGSETEPVVLLALKCEGSGGVRYGKLRIGSDLFAVFQPSAPMPDRAQFLQQWNASAGSESTSHTRVLASYATSPGAFLSRLQSRHLGLVAKAKTPAGASGSRAAAGSAALGAAGDKVFVYSHVGLGAAGGVGLMVELAFSPSLKEAGVAVRAVGRGSTFAAAGAEAVARVLAE